MAKGQVWPSEWSEFVDRNTGFRVRRLTNCPPSASTHFYFHQTAWSSDGRWLVINSNRGGKNDLYGIRMESGELVQLTEGGTGSADVSAHEPAVFYAAGNAYHRVDLDTLKSETIGTLPNDWSHYSGPSLTADGKSLVFAARMGEGKGLGIMAISSGTSRAIWRTAGTPSHITCSRTDADWIMHCDSTVTDAEPKQRVWVLSTDGKRHWHPYTQTAQEWLTHESWLGTTGKILACYWPTGIMELDIDGGESRLIARVNAWHAAATLDGRWCVVDSNWPDRGIHLVERETGRMCKLCESHSGTGGAADYQAHPHPSFSPDGAWVVFGSERSGNPEVYLAGTAQAIDAHDRWWKPEYSWHRW